MADEVITDADETPLLANGLPRPQPPLTLRERIEHQTEQLLAVLRSRREQPRDRAVSRSEDRPLLITVLAAVMAAVATVGAVWVWQSWAARSSPTIDELVPLAQAPGAAQETTAPAAPLSTEQSAVAPAPQAAASGATSSAPTAPDQPAAALASSGQSTVGQVAVHIAGAVIDPGVVYLPSGSRVVDAVIAGGGATTAAALDRLNLALPLEDGQQIYVPRVGEDVPETAANAPTFTSSPTESGGVDPPETLIDLNAATELELQSLPGIGPTMAAAIVGYRDSVGGFVAVDELVNVSGIGPTRLETLRSLVTVDGRVS